MSQLASEAHVTLKKTHTHTQNIDSLAFLNGITVEEYSLRWIYIAFCKKK